MKTFVELMRLFYLNIKLKILRGMQYRFDFFMGLFVSLVLSSLCPVFQYLVFIRLNGFPGWNLKQIILFQGAVLLWLGLKDTLFGEVRGNIEAIVRSGGFDRLLLKPYPPIGIILTSGFYYQGLGSIIAGLIVITFSIKQLGITISLWQWGAFLGFLACGVLLYMTITILYCIITIMIVFMGRLGDIIDKLFLFSQYPIEVFPRITRLLFVIFFPMAVWSYFPTQALLNRLDIKAFIGMAICFILLWVSLQLWNLSLKKYTSAGG